MNKMLLVAAVMVAACGAPSGNDSSAEAIDSRAATAREASGPDIPRILAEQKQLDSADAAEFQKRQASMETYQQCMEKAVNLEPRARAQIEAACKRLPTAPR